MNIIFGIVSISFFLHSTYESYIDVLTVPPFSANKCTVRCLVNLKRVFLIFAFIELGLINYYELQRSNFERVCEGRADTSPQLGNEGSSLNNFHDVIKYDTVCPCSCELQQCYSSSCTKRDELNRINCILGGLDNISYTELEDCGKVYAAAPNWRVSFEYAAENWTEPTAAGIMHSSCSFCNYAWFKNNGKPSLGNFGVGLRKNKCICNKDELEADLNHSKYSKYRTAIITRDNLGEQMYFQNETVGTFEHCSSTNFHGFTNRLTCGRVSHKSLGYNRIWLLQASIITVLVLLLNMCCFLCCFSICASCCLKKCILPCEFCFCSCHEIKDGKNNQSTKRFSNRRASSTRIDTGTFTAAIKVGQR